MDPADPTHYHGAGRLLSQVLTANNVTRIGLFCQFLDFNATTGALKDGGPCALWEPLTK